jgi:hypothetical protein
MIHPKKNPRDINQLAAKIVALSTGQTVEPEETEISPEKKYAVEFARKGGLAGGKARAQALSKAERVKIAQKAANARWENNPGK